MWYSELPFLTAVQVQQNWAFSNNVNLLAAGANNPSIGSTGTGIFAGRKGSLISVMEGNNKIDLYTATVPKIGLGDNIRITENVIRRPREEVAQMGLNSDKLENYNIEFCEISVYHQQLLSHKNIIFSKPAIACWSNSYEGFLLQ